MKLKDALFNRSYPLQTFLNVDYSIDEMCAIVLMDTTDMFLFLFSNIFWWIDDETFDSFFNLNILSIIDYCVGDMSLWNSSVGFLILVKTVIIKKYIFAIRNIRMFLLQSTNDVCITWYLICIDESFDPKLKCGSTKGKKNIKKPEFNSINWSLKVDDTLILKTI